MADITTTTDDFLIDTFFWGGGGNWQRGIEFLFLFSFFLLSFLLVKLPENDFQ